MHRYRVSLIVPFLFVFFVVSLLGVANASKSPKGSQRESKTLTLSNGLDVLLVHDPEVHRSAAALSVGTGQLYDPEEKMGLAHYLEHMLFLGTKKYPEVGSFKKYLTENSGGSNAYTAASITNYFFEVSHEAFEGAVDRFSDFFKEPLFDKKYSEREVNAVSSEHDKNIRSDGWRGNHVKSLIAEPGHPVSKFGTGNKETLAGDNRAALLDFYKRYYVARNMKLAIISNKTLPSLEKLVKTYFQNIPDRPFELPHIDSDYRKPLNGKYRLLKIKTLKDLRSLELEFPTIRLIDHLGGKPASIVATVIGHEGKGSLLSELKNEGLALGLSAGGGFAHPNLNSFSIKIALTEKGVAEYERVLELAFSYIEMLRKHGIQKYTYDETATMAQIDFDWKDPDEGIGFVASRAGLMHDYKLEDVETLPYLYTQYEPEAYVKLLNTLTPENCMVVLQNNKVQTDRTEPFYGAEYSITKIGGKAFDRLKHPPVVSTMYYPEKNDFIPYDLELIEEKPHLVWDDDIARVWFQFDNRFKQPRAFLKLRIETPLVYDNVKNTMRAKLYDAAIHEGLNELVYPIQLAGLSYSLGLEKKGIILTIGGYSERIPDLLRLVTRNLLDVTINQEKFDNLKDAMIRGLENRKLAQAYSRGGYYNTLLSLEKQYTEEEQLEALKPVTLEEVSEFARRLYDRVYITGMAHGNWSDDKVRESVRTVLEAIGSKPLPESDRFEQVVHVLEPGERIMFSRQVMDHNNSISYGIQVGEKNMKLQAVTSMIASIVESDFYTQMRTNQQLGYIVWSFKRRIEDMLYFKLLIQSGTYGPFELNRRIEAWLETTRALFADLSDEEFERHRASLIVSLEKEGESIAEVLGDYYYMVTEEDEDFDYKKKLIAEVKKLKKSEVSDAAKWIFLDQKTPRLIVLIRSHENSEPVPAGVFQDVIQFKNRKTTHASRPVQAGGGS